MTISSPSDDSTAGEIYTLECFANVTGSKAQPNISWIDGLRHQPVRPDMIETFNSTSMLTFKPLTTAHGGVYECEATVDKITAMISTVVSVNSK